MTPTDFVFPAGATAPVALEVSRALYGSPEWRELLPYCGALDAFIRTGPSPDGRGPAPSRGWRAVAEGLPVDHLLPAGRHAPWKGDVVVVGECARPAEVRLMIRLVDGVVKSGRTVLYVCVNRTEQAALRSAARRKGWQHRVTLAKVATAEYAPHRFWLHPEAWRRFDSDWSLLEPLLRTRGAHLRPAARRPLREITLAKVQWRRLRAELRFDAAVVRTRYLPLSAALLADLAGSPAPTVSLQHSVVTSPASFAPLPAARYLCFGRTSSAVLERIDADMARSTGRRRICGELLPAGSLVDPVPEVAEPRRTRTVLLVDQDSSWASRYFGEAPGQDRALFRAAEVLADGVEGVDRVLVRLHPAHGRATEWRALADRLGPGIEIASGRRPLERDLTRASAAVGLFSTVLPVAAAAGLPTFFLREPGWYYTPDLDAFAPERFVEPASLADRVGAALRDEATRAQERERCLAAAADYFEGGRTCAFDAAFVDRMLAPTTSDEVT